MIYVPAGLLKMATNNGSEKNAKCNLQRMNRVAASPLVDNEALVYSQELDLASSRGTNCSGLAKY